MAAAAAVQGALAALGLVNQPPATIYAQIDGIVAHRAQINSARAKEPYQDFLALWAHADPDVAVLKEAKAEYAKLEAVSASTGPHEDDRSAR